LQGRIQPRHSNPTQKKKKKKKSPLDCGTKSLQKVVTGEGFVGCYWGLFFLAAEHPILSNIFEPKLYKLLQCQLSIAHIFNFANRMSK
jgi:hypothetical protein